MNITKEETIRALLDSDKVASVDVVFHYDNFTDQERVDTNRQFQSQINYHVNLRGANLKSFEVNLVPITEFNEGDIVWCLSRNKQGIYEGFDNGWGHLVKYDNFDDQYTESSKLILIKKGELNND